MGKRKGVSTSDIKLKEAAISDNLFHYFILVET
jgi:hypothetical protein